MGRGAWCPDNRLRFGDNVGGAGLRSLACARARLSAASATGWHCSRHRSTPGTVARWLQLMSGGDVVLRRGSRSDAYALWLWANDDETRGASFGRESIPWEMHVEWLERTP